jgi:branched-chain amino acid transport system permease protein
MDLTDVLDRTRDFATGSVGGALVTVAAIVLLVDLLAKLVGFSAGPLGGSLETTQLAGYLWNGLIIGLVVGLASIGLSLTYSILGFANFAHGDYLTAGAFSGWAVVYVLAGLGGVLNMLGTFLFLVTGLGEKSLADADLVELVLLRAPPLDAGANLWLSPIALVVGLAVAIVATVAVALIVDRLVYDPMRDAEGISLLIASVGVAFVLRYLIALVFGEQRRIVTSTDKLPSGSYGGIVVNAHEVTLVVAALSLMLGLHLLLQRTKLGKAMRAMADNRDLAQITGIPTDDVIRWTWIIGAGLTGAAGFLLVLSQGGLGFTSGWRLLLLIFAAVIMGGIGSIYGAIAGGLLIGVTSRVSLVWLQGDFSSFAEPTAFVLMILVLLFRPQGIFGGVRTA